MNRIRILIGSVCMLLWGCHSTELRTSPGNSGHVAASGAAVHLVQSENPKESSTQDFTSDDTETLVLPPGTAFVQPDEEAKLPRSNGSASPPLFRGFIMPEPGMFTRTHHEGSVTKIGAAQKDTLGDTIAKLKSAKSFIVIGIGIMLFGLAFATVPYLRLIAGSFVPGAVVAGAGLVIAVLPYFIIGNEKFFALALVGTAFLAGLVIWVHKHGGVTAELATLKNALAAPVAQPVPQTTAAPATASTSPLFAIAKPK